jgi:hypothetical protein
MSELYRYYDKFTPQEQISFEEKLLNFEEVYIIYTDKLPKRISGLLDRSAIIKRMEPFFKAVFGDELNQKYIRSLITSDKYDYLLANLEWAVLIFTRIDASQDILDVVYIDVEAIKSHTRFISMFGPQFVDHTKPCISIDYDDEDLDDDYQYWFDYLNQYFYRDAEIILNS